MLTFAGVASWRQGGTARFSMRYRIDFKYKSMKLLSQALGREFLRFGTSVPTVWDESPTSMRQESLPLKLLSHLIETVVSMYETVVSPTGTVVSMR